MRRKIIIVALTAAMVVAVPGCAPSWSFRDHGADTLSIKNPPTEEEKTALDDLMKIPKVVAKKLKRGIRKISNSIRITSR